MGAVTLWVRSILRRRWGATVALAVLAGLAAGVVGASIQAARRADGAIERYAERSRGYDVVVYGCPPDVEPPNQLSITELVDRCVNNHMAVRLAQEVLADRPEVESWTTTGTLIAGVLDEAKLQAPAEQRPILGGRRGHHSEHLVHLMAVMQHIPRLYPDAKW